MSTKRRAPAGGYRFAAKEQYRSVIWTHFREAVGKPGIANVFLMPSAEGLEIEVAESKGFRRDRMHVCDFNPAIVASLTARYPGLRRPGYGVSAERAIERIGMAGIKLQAANFDFTSSLSEPLHGILRRITATDVFDTGAVVAFTVLRGRETGSANEFLRRATVPVEIGRRVDVPGLRPEDAPGILLSDMKAKTFGDIDLTARDASRLAFVSVGLMGDHRTPRLIRCGAYRSSTQTMLWGIFRVERPVSVNDKVRPRTIRRRMREHRRMLSLMRTAGGYMEVQKARLLREISQLEREVSVLADEEVA